MFFSVFLNDTCSSVVSTSSVKSVARLLAHLGGSGVILSNSECLPKTMTQKVWGKHKKQDDFIASAFKLLGWNLLVFLALGAEERLITTSSTRKNKSS